jgi:hypothetical protein
MPAPVCGFEVACVVLSFASPTAEIVQRFCFLFGYVCPCFFKNSVFSWKFLNHLELS